MLRRCLLALLIALSLPLPASPHWPEATYTARPWLRWYWPGGVADKEGISRQLKEVAESGFGGVCLSVSPGDPGFQPHFRPWLGPGWLEMVIHAANEAERFGLGFDLDTAGARNLGGPSVTPDHQDHRLDPILHDFKGGPLQLELPPPSPSMLMAQSAQGEAGDLMPLLDGDILSWDAPAGHWSIFGIRAKAAPQPLLDPAPGAEGAALDPFSPLAMSALLGRIDEAMQLYDAPFPRTRFLDGSGAVHADWSPVLPGEFKARRGYPLATQLPALFGEAEGGEVERVLGDYRETLADLRFKTIETWHQWANAQGSVSRAAVHGDAGHPVDLPALIDVPGVVIRGDFDDQDLDALRFASSSATLTTKPLVSAEFHAAEENAFRIAPEELKARIDRLWLAGANHVTLHGMALSPEEAIWPGSLAPDPPHLGLPGALSDSLPGLARYITRCQSILQEGAPDPEVLLFFPAHDYWVEGDAPAPGSLGEWMSRSGFKAAAERLEAAGIPYAVVSDRLIGRIKVERGNLILGELPFRTMILPEVRRLSENTALKILEISQRGGHFTIVGDWPREVPGLILPDIRRGTLFQAFRQIPESTFSQGDDLIGLLEARSVETEGMAAMGLSFVRRSHLDGRYYFIANHSGRRCEGWIPLAGNPKDVIRLDPLIPDMSGSVRTRIQEGSTECWLNLSPSESVILKTSNSDPFEEPPSPEPDETAAILLSGSWQIEFLGDGSRRPSSVTSPGLGSWTTLDDPLAHEFSGTARYTLRFEHSLPAEDDGFLLDLGGVADSARVRLNGADLGDTFASPHRLWIGKELVKGENLLEIEVTNLPANRFAAEARRHQGSGTPLIRSARSWAPRASGLLGPVRLVPLSIASP